MHADYRCAQRGWCRVRWEMKLLFDKMPRLSLFFQQVLSLLGSLYTIWRRPRTNGDNLGLLVSISYCEDFLPTLNTRWLSMGFEPLGTITTPPTGCRWMGSRCDRRWGDGWDKPDPEIDPESTNTIERIVINHLVVVSSRRWSTYFTPGHILRLS